MRRARAVGLGLVLLAGALLASAQERADRPERQTAASATKARRVVSMNPSLTAILLALGARDVLVGVDEFSAREQPAVADLPRVGGLYNPSLEAVVALRPDLVLLVPSFEQREFRARLADVGVAVRALDPLRFDQVLDSIDELGRLVGREAEARARVASIRRTRVAVERAVQGRSRPRTVLVLQREPLFVAGSGSFLHEMLEAAGAQNLGAQLGDPYPRASLEWLVAAAPEVILDSAPDAAGAHAFWSRWPSLPAVSAGRVVRVEPGLVTLPGPELGRALVALAGALHGPAATAGIAPP